MVTQQSVFPKILLQIVDPKEIPDTEILHVMEELKTLLSLPGNEDKKLCEATRRLVWKVICVSTDVPHSILCTRYAERIDDLLSKAIEKAQTPEFKNNISSRRSEIKTFFESGKVHLTEKVQKYIEENFGENAKQIIQFLEEDFEECD
jgi:hypothetical protein